MRNDVTAYRTERTDCDDFLSALCFEGSRVSMRFRQIKAQLAQ